MPGKRAGFGRPAAVLVAIGLALVSCGLAYNVWSLVAQGAIRTGGAVPSERAGGVLRWLSLMLSGTLILAVALLLGSLVMVRVGRAFKPGSPRDVIESL